ncbi:sulfatase [Aurantiacibacter sp. MUD61]|uniref:sulfatase n=1 Tax=Aurantiacibacter sp. MUD61 TaxID=3009083 RepID=UPI0022F10F04|nr:sulfatase [Aurantiacibacter sp. MUD61]
MRTQLARVVAGVAGALALAACTATGPAETARSANPHYPQQALGEMPNVLFIAIDDLRPDIGVYGNPVVNTPNIDAFAESALLFENAFVSQAVCGPSRAALMTGLRPDTTGITTLQQPVSETVPDAVTMSQTFLNAGYESIGIGKIYHHRDDDMEGWTDRPDDAIYEWRQSRRRAGIPNLSNERFSDIEEMPDTMNVRDAQERLQRLGGTDDPFFMMVGIHHPHLPFNSTDEEWEALEGANVPAPINPDGQAGAPPWALVSYEIWNYDDTPEGLPMPDAQRDELRRAYLASVSYADRLVGELLAELEASGRADDTIVVIWSDHGFKIGDHANYAKHSTADIDIRIPLLIRVPGMATAGERSDALVESVDLYPTLAELAGLSTPNNLEGLSFVPLLADPALDWKEAAFAQYGRYIRDSRSGNGRGTGYTVRTQRYRYTAWVMDDSGELVAQELYDLDSDPDESTNVAGESAYANDLAHLERLRTSGWQSVRAGVALP